MDDQNPRYTGSVEVNIAYTKVMYRTCRWAHRWSGDRGLRSGRFPPAPAPLPEV